MGKNNENEYERGKKKVIFSKKNENQVLFKDFNSFLVDFKKGLNDIADEIENGIRKDMKVLKKGINKIKDAGEDLYSGKDPNEVIDNLRNFSESEIEKVGRNLEKNMKKGDYEKAANDFIEDITPVVEDFVSYLKNIDKEYFQGYGKSSLQSISNAVKTVEKTVDNFIDTCKEKGFSSAIVQLFEKVNAVFDKICNIFQDLINDQNLKNK